MPGSVQSGVSSLHDSVGSAAAPDAILRPGQEDGETEEKAFSHGVMGVMYTVCKEKGKPSIGFICFRLFVDWWQLWLLVVQPPYFDLPSHELWWRIFSFIGLNQFMSTRGYTFFLACFYLLVAGLVLSVALSVWVGVSFQQNRFDHVWPIVLLRWFAKVFYQMLDVMSLSLFLMALDCQLFFRDSDVIGFNQQFPEIYCWTMPHLVHVFVAIIATVVFIVMDCFFVVGEIEMDFTSRNDLAIMHTGVELQTFTIRVLMTLVSVFVYNPKWASVSQMILSVYLTYLMCYWQPQVEGWVNHVRTGMYASVAWCSMLYVVLAFNLGWDASIPEVSKNAIWIITMIMWVSTIPAGMVGAWMSWLRLRHLNTVVLNKFRYAYDPHVEDAYQFTDSRFVEVLARCCRVWVDKNTLQPDNVILAEKVLQAACQQLPEDPFVIILYSSFLMDVQKSYQSGYAELQAVKKLDISPLIKFAIFSREQQHAQRGAGGVGKTDLVSYVEFKRNYAMILKIHREALNHITRFWEALMHRNVKFRTLTETVRAMDASIRQAERTYKQVLQRHATSVKMVRLYAKFLEDVKQDPWAASRWFSEAERLEAVEEEVKHHDALGGLEIDDPALRAALLEAGPMSGAAGDGRAIVIINAQSIIQMTNQAAHNLLGYSKAELAGKGLRMLLPACVADVHATFVRNFIQQGQRTAMNSTSQQLIVHKDKRLVPVALTVTKISGIGEDTLIMAVLEEIRLPPNVATVWLMMDGRVLTACPKFEDWFGFPEKELVSQMFNGLVVNGGSFLEKGIQQARQAIQDAQHTLLLEKAATFKFARGNSSGLGLARSDTTSFLAKEILQAMDSKPDLDLNPQYMSRDPDADDWLVPGVQIAHKYGQPTDVDITIRNAGVGVLKFNVLLLKKTTARAKARVSDNLMLHNGTNPAAPVAPLLQDLMLVTNMKSQVLHMTSALAEMLGRSKQPLAMLSLENLMAKPFGQLHKATIQASLPTTSFAYSCRSGLSVLLQSHGPQGQEEQQPFKLHIKKKVTSEETQFVVVMQQSSMQSALDERRLLLELDEHGIVSKVASATPATVFGVEPERLMGKHAGSFIDVLRTSDASDEPDLIEQQQALEILLEMLVPALGSSSTSWRCGFLVPEASPAGAESLAAAKVKQLLAGKAKPVCMRLRAKMPEGADDQGSRGLTLEMELWRADLVTSIIEIDNEGNIQLPEAEELAELYPPDLLLGTCLEDMVDHPVSAFVSPLASKSLSELYVAGAFGKAPQASESKHSVAGAKRSAMKSQVQPGAGNSSAGPVHVMHVTHHSDRADMVLSVQAVRKTAGRGGMYLILHPVKPSCGRPDFSKWILAAGAEKVQAGPTTAQLSDQISALLKSVATVDADTVPDVTLDSVGHTNLRAARLPGTPPRMSTPGSTAFHNQDALDVASLDRASPAPDMDIGHNSDSDPGVSHAQNAQRLLPWIQEQSSLVIDAPDKSPFLQENRPKHKSGINWGADQHQLAPPEELKINDDEHQPNEALALDIADEAAAQAEAVDESDYKRGQRFKKLYTILSNATVQYPVENYRKKAFILAAATVLIELGAFITMLILLRSKSVMVQDLTFIGKSAIAATEIATYARTMNLIYANMTVPNLRLASSPDDMPYLKDLTHKDIEDFAALHAGSYLGFHAPRRLPADYGLRYIWEEPHLTVTDIAVIQFNQSLGNFTVMKRINSNRLIGLWEAGNEFSQRAANFLQNADAYNLSLNGSVMNFGLNPDLQWLILNGPQAVFPGYLRTLDAYVAMLLDSIKSSNKVQLILLVLEGVVACAVISAWMYLLLKKVADQRYKIFHIFIIVPTSLVRRLATKQYLLGDEEEEDVQEAVDAARAAPAGLASGRQAAKQQEEGVQGKGGASKVNIHIKATTKPEGAPAPEGFLGRLWSRAKALVGIKKPEQALETKRKLLPCIRQTAWLLWPFILWGALMVLGNVMGYLLLDQIAAPVAMFNMVNYVRVMYNRNNFFLQELTYEPDPAKMNDHRQDTTERINELAKEYSVLLYGNQVVPNETAAHYTLVTSGIAHTGAIGAEILFHTTECLCLNQSECQPPEAALYTDTRQGLNRMFLKYIEIGRYIDKFQFLDPYLNGPEYDYYWNTRPDIQGGLAKLTDAYQQFVIANIESVLTLHVIMFVFSLLIVLGFVIFMLRPFLKVTKYETRRIAELLSQLPAEVDMKSVVQQVLLPAEADPATGGQGLPA